MDTGQYGCYSPAMPPPAHRLLPIAVVFGIALALRLAVAAWLPLTADEADSILDFQVSALWLDQERWVNPPLWRLLVMGALQGTDSLFVLRLLSALLAAVGCAAMTAGLLVGGRGAMGPLAAALAGLGLAVTPWAARSQAQVRAYGLTLLAAVAILLALRSVLARPDRRSHLLAGGAIGAAAWVHYALLPWVGPWLLAVIWTCRRAGRDAPDPSTARRQRLRALVQDAGPGVLLGALGLSVPIHQAAHGWLVKRGAASVSMVDPAGAMDLVWRPEVLLVVAVLAAAALAWRTRPADVALALVGLALAAVVVVASGWTQTVRWTHLAVAAPALWLGLAVLLDMLSPGRRRALATATALGLLLSLATLVGTTASHHRRADDLELATWRGHVHAPHLAAWTLGEGDDISGVGRGLLHAAGAFTDGPERCLGADRVHLSRCRTRVRALSRTDCRALCDDTGCIWQLAGLPQPLTPITDAKQAPCTPGVLATRLPLTLAVLITEPGPKPTVAALAERLHLSPKDGARLQLQRVGRWWVLTPRRAPTPAPAPALEPPSRAPASPPR